MENLQTQLQAIFDELCQLSTVDKIKFIEALLFYFTISGRGLSSDSSHTDAEKVNAFKWMNELLHRIWHIHAALRLGQDDDSIKRLFENMKFYSEQSDLLKMHLLPAISGASQIFNASK